MIEFEPSQSLTVGNVKEYMLHKGYPKEEQQLFHSFYRFTEDETVLTVSQLELTVRPRGKQTQHISG